MSELLQNLKKVGLQLLGSLLFTFGIYILIWLGTMLISFSGMAFFSLFVMKGIIGIIFRGALVIWFITAYNYQNKKDLWKEFYG